MELFIELYGNLFTGYQKKLLRIKTFEMIISDYKDNTAAIEEFRIHVKYITTKEISKTEIEIIREDTKERYKMKLKEDETMNFLNAIIHEKATYDSFIKEYYTNNDSYNLIEGDSFIDYFTSIKAFISELNKGIESIGIDPHLKEILDVQNKFLNKITYYIKMIDSNYLKLNIDNEEEGKLMNRSCEVKTLLEELSEVITSCTYGLTSDEIENYIVNFKNLMKQKSKEILMLIEEIKYTLGNYLTLKFDKGNDSNGNGNGNGLYGDVFNTKEEEIARLMLENEQLKLQIESIDIENDIINQFLIENESK